MDTILKPHPIGCNCRAHTSPLARQREAQVEGSPARPQRARTDGRPPGAGAGAPPLGTNAKLRAKPQNPMGSRLQRFALQSVARSILPTSRTAKCMRIRTGRTDVQVWKSKAHHTTSYGGLQTCGSVWACPVCAAKIAERRRVELLDAMEMHKAQGGVVSLLTLTTPHQRGDNLAALPGTAGQGPARLPQRPAGQGSVFRDGIDRTSS